MAHTRYEIDTANLEIIPSEYNIWFKKNKDSSKLSKNKNSSEEMKPADPFIQVSIDEAIFSAKKEDFKCFQFRHLKNDKNLPVTQIRMITIEGVKVNYGEWQ